MKMKFNNSNSHVFIFDNVILQAATINFLVQSANNIPYDHSFSSMKTVHGLNSDINLKILLALIVCLDNHLQPF